MKPWPEIVDATFWTFAIKQAALLKKETKDTKVANEVYLD